MTRADIPTASRDALGFALLAAMEERDALREENATLKARLFVRNQYALGTRVGLALVRGSRFPDVGGDEPPRGDPLSREDIYRTEQGC